MIFVEWKTRSCQWFQVVSNKMCKTVYKLSCQVINSLDIICYVTISNSKL